MWRKEDVSPMAAVTAAVTKAVSSTFGKLDDATDPTEWFQGLQAQIDINLSLPVSWDDSKISHLATYDKALVDATTKMFADRSQALASDPPKLIQAISLDNPVYCKAIGFTATRAASRYDLLPVLNQVIFSLVTIPPPLGPW